MVRDLASALSRQGIETHVATTDDNGPETLRVPYGVPVIQNGATYWYFPRKTRVYTASWPLATWLARHVSAFDVVHMRAMFAFPTLPAALWSDRCRLPSI